MTLKEVIDSLNNIALSQPDVNDYIKSGNIYDLNSERNAKYSVFCCTQDVHNYDIENAAMDYRFIIYYVDRLQSDADNKLEVQSTGIQTLNNILRTFQRENDVDVTNISHTVFTESFAGLCAGDYATFTVTVYDDGCEEKF